MAEEQKKRQSGMKGKPAWNRDVERTERRTMSIRYTDGHKQLYENGYTNPITGKKR